MFFVYRVLITVRLVSILLFLHYRYLVHTYIKCTDNIIISGNCSDKRTVVGRQFAPTGPKLDPEHVGLWMDKHGLVPVVNVTWEIMVDGR